MTVGTAERSGHLVKYATVYSNDLTAPSLVLSVSLEVGTKGP